MDFIKNIQFTCLVKCEGKLREFNFRKRNKGIIPFYNVNMVDLTGTRHQFNMDRAEGKWIIRELDLPRWILYAESQLSMKIDENEVQINS